MNEVTCYTCNKPVDSEADTTHWSECGDYAWCQECVDAEVARAEAIPLAELANLVEHAAENQSVLDPYVAMRIAELLRKLPQIQAREQAQAMAARKHFSLAHSRLQHIANAAAQTGKTETANVYRAAAEIVGEELEAYRAAASAPAATQARHIKTGKVYAIVGAARHKHLGERWVDTVAYQDEAGELFTREVSNFEQSFERLATAPAGAKEGSQ